MAQILKSFFTAVRSNGFVGKPAFRAQRHSRFDGIRPSRQRATACSVVTVMLGVSIICPAGVRAGQEVLSEGLASPRLARLAAAIKQRNDDALGLFWQEVEREGTPLLEADSRHPGYSLVTFLYRTSDDDLLVELESNITSIDAKAEAASITHLPLTRLGGSDILFLTLRLRNDLRAPYHLRVQRPGSEPEEVTDPRNPLIWEPEEPALRASILELTGAPPQPWRKAGAEEGDWDELVLRAADGVEHTIRVYKPVGWHGDATPPYPALVGLGAFGAKVGMRVDWMVDHLVAAGLLPPIVVLLMDVDEESEARRYEPTDAFVADVLLPYAREHYGVSPRPEDIAVSGTSRRGMVAALMAFRRPDVVGNVLSLSGSYYWKPHDEQAWVWVPRTYAQAERRTIRLYIGAGLLETFVNPGNHGHYLVGTNRHFRDVLQARGYDFTYVEFNGVHSELCWQDWLAKGLVHLFGGGTQ